MKTTYKSQRAEEKAAAARAKLRHEGKLPPPPHVMPRHKRNSWRWKFKPWKGM